MKPSFESNSDGAVGGTVWIVDDSRLEAERTRNLLEGTYALRSFEEGGAMLEAIASTKELPDLILLDWQMPGVSGLEACHFLRERFDEVSLPILMLTTRGAKSDFTEGLSAGANDYVAKPYDDAELLARVRTLVRIRRQAEAMRAREELFATTLRSIADAVITTSPAGIVTFMNRCAQELTGWTADAAVGKPFAQVFVAHHVQSRMRVADLAQSAVREGRTVTSEGETLLTRLDGKQVPVDESASPIGEAGVLGAVIVARDATERRRAIALAKDRADLEEKLIGIVSHDLRSPLNAILIGANVLLGREHADERTLRVLARMRSSAERATRLVGDLLDFTQARLGGSIKIQRRDGDLHQIAEQVVDELQSAHSEREIAVTAEGDASTALDADRVAQVITNLVANALKHGQSGGKVLVCTRGEGTGVVLEVTNVGPAIPGALLPVLFEPLTRASGAALGDRSVGLGLYIVKHIVEAHGGTVVVDSDDARTTFSVRLPRAASA